MVVIAVARWSRIFDGRPEEVAEARRFARVICDDHEIADVVALVVSELSTNAVEHTASGGPGGLFVVELEVDPAEVRVAVVDMGSDSEPSTRLNDPADPWSVSGRGLCIVEAVAAKWGAEPVRVGRRVWALIEAGV